MRALVLALFLLVAVGISQPGGAGTTVFLEDNTNGDAGGDGSYQFADIATKLPTQLVANAGAAEAEYRGLATIQIGDGTNSNPSTLKDTNVTVVLDAAKTIQTAANGTLANRRFEMGTKIGSGNTPGGRDGVKIRAATQPILRGNIFIYGSLIRSAAGIILLPGLGSPGIGEIVSSRIEWSNAGGQIGNPSTGNFALIYNVSLVFSGAAGTVATFGADYADLVTFIGSGGFGRFINSTVASLELSRPIFVGSPSVADIRQGSSVAWNLYEPTWSQQKAQFDAVFGTIGEWWGFDPLFYDPRTNTPKSGIPVDVLDRFGVMVADAVTDSEGRITYNSGLATKRLKQRIHANVAGVPAFTEQGPFTLRINHKGNRNYAFTADQRAIVWPGFNYAFGRQLVNCAPNIALVPTSPSGQAGNEEWRPSI